jgi:hypothetical protein
VYTTAMILLLHITIALSSVAFTTYAFFHPSKPKMKTSYGLVAATVASGTLLAVSNLSHILHTCIVGLLYIVGITVILAATHKKLAHASTPGNHL